MEWTLGCRGFRYIGIQSYADRLRAVPPFWQSPSRELKNSLKKKRLMLVRRGELLDNVDTPQELHEWGSRKVRAKD